MNVNINIDIDIDIDTIGLSGYRATGLPAGYRARVRSFFRVAMITMTDTTSSTGNRVLDLANKLWEATQHF